MSLLAWVIESPFVSSALSLVAACVFSTLKASYQCTGEAGVSRLYERNETLTARLEIWEDRWNSLVVTLNLFSIFFRLGFVTLLLYGCLPRIEGGAGFGFAFIAATTLLVWIFCYLAPSAVSEAFADRITVRTLPIVGLLTRLISPVSIPLSWLQGFLERHLMAGSDEDSRPSPEDEIRSLVDQAHERDIEPDERNMIRSIFDLGDTVVREIMTPRVDIIGLEHTSAVRDAAKKVCSTAHSRFPVYRETVDEIVGIIHIKDLLAEMTQDEADTPVGRVAKPVAFVPETMPIQDLLALMQKRQYQVTMVVDEYGGTAGLVTMEDIIEEIVGEIHDEYDQEKLAIQPLKENSYIIDARVNVEELNDRLDTGIPESEEYDSLGGFILHRLGHIPQTGEQVVLDDLTLTVKSASAQQILTIQAELLDSAHIPVS